VFDFRHNRTGSSSVRTTVLVVSPLVSLMIDQVESLRKRGVSAAILSGNEGVERSLLAQGKDLLVRACCLHPLKPLLELRGGGKNLYSHHFLTRLLQLLLMKHTVFPSSYTTDN